MEDEPQIEELVAELGGRGRGGRGGRGRGRGRGRGAAAVAPTTPPAETLTDEPLTAELAELAGPRLTRAPPRELTHRWAAPRGASAPRAWAESTRRRWPWAASTCRSDAELLGENRRRWVDELGAQASARRAAAGLQLARLMAREAQEVSLLLAAAHEDAPPICALEVALAALAAADGIAAACAPPLSRARALLRRPEERW